MNTVWKSFWWVELRNSIFYFSFFSERELEIYFNFAGGKTWHRERPELWNVCAWIVRAVSSGLRRVDGSSSGMILLFCRTWIRQTSSSYKILDDILRRSVRWLFVCRLLSLIEKVWNSAWPTNTRRYRDNIDWNILDNLASKSRIIMVMKIIGGAVRCSCKRLWPYLKSEERQSFIFGFIKISVSFKFSISILSEAPNFLKDKHSRLHMYKSELKSLKMFRCASCKTRHQRRTCTTMIKVSIRRNA